MATKPSSKPFWATTGVKTEPSGSKKATGWLKLEKPPYQFFNWLFNTLGGFVDYLSGNAQYNIIVGGDSDEQDYATMAAYIADSPAVGDRVLIKGDEVLAATLVIPGGIEVTMLKGNKFTLVTNFSPIIQLGNNVNINGEIRVENSDTGTIAKGFSFLPPSAGGINSNLNNLILENKSTGTITDAFYIEASAEGNYSQCRAINSGGGTITNDLTDNSGNDKNLVTVKGDSAISRSRGAKKFDILDVTQLKLKKGADIASATALVLGADGNYFDVTGTTTITSIGTLGIGFVVRLHFDATLILTHDATDLVLPGGENITTAAGDEAEFVEYATGDWRCTNYSKAKTFRGALVERNAVQIIPDFTNTDVVWDNEIYDTDEIHDNSVNPERLTVPSGASKIRLNFSIGWEIGGTGDRKAFVTKNGGYVAGLPFDTRKPVSTSFTFHSAASSVLEVSPGDYFALTVIHSQGADLDVENNASWFAMEIIE